MGGWTGAWDGAWHGGWQGGQGASTSALLLAGTSLGTGFAIGQLAGAEAPPLRGSGGSIGFVPMFQRPFRPTRRLDLEGVALGGSVAIGRLETEVGPMAAARIVRFRARRRQMNQMLALAA